jgi:hypothetical protein
MYAPQNLAKLQTGVKEELALLVKDGVTAAELAMQNSLSLRKAIFAVRKIRHWQATCAASYLSAAPWRLTLRLKRKLPH